MTEPCHLQNVSLQTLRLVTLCRPDFGQSLMSAAAATKTAPAAGPPSLCRVSAPVMGPQTAFPGPSAVASGPTAAAPAMRGTAGTVQSPGAPNLARPSAPGPLGAAALQAREAASDDYRQGHFQQPILAQPSASGHSRQGNSQLPPSGAPAKPSKSKGVMASVLGSVKKAVGIKSRTKDMQG